MARRIRLDGEQRRVLRHLRSHGPTSRIGLAERLDLSPTAMTTLARSLLDIGLVEEAEAGGARTRGRPATPLRIAPAGGYSVGVAIHRGVVEIAWVDFSGGVIDRVEEPFDEITPEVCAAMVRRRLHDLADSRGLLGARLFGVGVGVPGNPRPGSDSGWMVIRSLQAWRDVPLRSIFQDALNVPVWVQNDANAAALAEYYLGGLMTRCANALVILLGHGLGAGIIADGRLLLGEHGDAGDIGCLYPSGRPRPSTMDLLDVLRRDGSPVTSVADIDEDLESHAAIVDEWIDRAARQLRSSIDAGLVWFNPGEVVVSSPLPERLLGRLVNRINGHRWREGFYSEYPLTVGTSSLGHSAIALGSALLPIHGTEAAT